MQSNSIAYEGPDALIPPTFLITAGQWASAHNRVDVGFDRARLLHGEQEYVFHGQLPRAGQQVWATERIVDRYERTGRRGGAMRFAVIVTEFRDDAGVLVAEARATLVERGSGTHAAQS